MSAAGVGAEPPVWGHWYFWWLVTLPGPLGQGCHVAGDSQCWSPSTWMEPSGGCCADPRGDAEHTTTHARVAKHLLVESLVFYPTLPEVFAGFWCWGKICENDFLFLKEKDKESPGETSE